METIWFCARRADAGGLCGARRLSIWAPARCIFAARTEEERRTVLRSIGPVWDGNEVWLLAGGGTLFFAFPLLYASSFSGFYLALIIVLWLLIFRASASSCACTCRTPSGALLSMAPFRLRASC